MGHRQKREENVKKKGFCRQRHIWEIGENDLSSLHKYVNMSSLKNSKSLSMWNYLSTYSTLIKIPCTLATIQM